MKLVPLPENTRLAGGTTLALAEVACRGKTFPRPAGGCRTTWTLNGKLVWMVPMSRMGEIQSAYWLSKAPAISTVWASPPRVFFTVALPISKSALAGGAAMSWARALGEFGATLMFAGNLSGRTQTLPLAIYTALESDLRTAQSLSIVLVAVAFALLVAMRVGTRT